MWGGSEGEDSYNICGRFMRPESVCFLPKGAQVFVQGSVQLTIGIPICSLPKDSMSLVGQIVLSNEIQRLLRLLKISMQRPENLRQFHFFG